MLTLCPKHSKPYPCGRCRIENAQKPAQTAPAPVVSPEVRRKIEESLTAAPIARQEPERAVEVETSRGARTVHADADQDDAGDVVDRSRSRGIGRRYSKRPAYLKSVAHPIVPTADPEAPYGRDTENRPILPGRDDQQLASDLLSKPFLKAGSCPHKSNPKYCLLCGTANYKAAPAEPIDLEDQLRRLFGITEFVAPGRVESRKYDYFPEVLGITRGQLIGCLELVVGIEPRAIKKRVLKSHGDIDRKIAELERAAARIAELNKAIKESEEIINGLSVRVLKLRRSPDDPLLTDKATREKLKREESKNIEKYKTEKRELQRLLRDSDISQLKQRVAAWGSNPNEYETVSATEDVAVKFGDKFAFRQDEEDEDSTAAYTIDGYVSLLDQYDLLKDVSRRLPKFPVLGEWRYFENEIVLQAIGWKLVRPTKQAFSDYPQLAKYLDGAPIDEPEQDDPEDKLILKTGGALIGGGIYSAGHRNDRQRPLESFDKRKPSYGPGEPLEHGGERADTFYAELDSGDVEERNGDE